MTWLGSNSGCKIELLNPDPSQFNLEDIATGLSRIARFNGQTKARYSVAEHSMNVAALVPEHLKLQALLHDATEAYICDVPSPLKAILGETYRVVERRIATAIGSAFGIDLVDLPQAVKDADMIMLITEHHLLQENPIDWEWDKDMLRLPRVPYIALSEDEARKHFIAQVGKYANQGL